MRDITKAQLTVGLLAFFATVWVHVKQTVSVKQIDLSVDLIPLLSMIILMFGLMLLLSFIILSLLEWVKIFDLKTNAILTLITLVTIPILTISV